MTLIVFFPRKVWWCQSYGVRTELSAAILKLVPMVPSLPSITNYMSRLCHGCVTLTSRNPQATLALFDSFLRSKFSPVETVSGDFSGIALKKAYDKDLDKNSHILFTFCQFCASVPLAALGVEFSLVHLRILINRISLSLNSPPIAPPRFH